MTTDHVVLNKPIVLKIRPTWIAVGWLIGYRLGRTRVMRTYGPSLRRPEPWAMLPMNRDVGGAIFTKPWQIFGGKTWSLTLHTSIKPYRLHRSGENAVIKISETED